MASNFVMGTAAWNILNGKLPDGDKWCCAHPYRVCWHHAAALLLANGLRPLPQEAPEEISAEDAGRLW
jgi:hypothetical protein